MKNAPTASAETRSPITKPPENPVNNVGIFTSRMWRAAFVFEGRVLNARDVRGDGRQLANLPSAVGAIAGWLIQLPICLRTSAGTLVNRKPPLFCVSSVHASSPSASIEWLCSDNEKWIVPVPSMGAMDRKQSPPSETFKMMPPLSGSRLM
jgi:hypothetical protein